MSELKTILSEDNQKEKDHRGNGGLIEKNLNQLQDNTKEHPEVKRTSVLFSAGTILLKELNTAYQQLACAKQQVELCGVKIDETRSKLQMLGFDPDRAQSEIDRMKSSAVL